MSPPTAAAPHPDEFSHRTVRANGISFHVVESGPVGGEPVLLLHGFPEFSYSWRHQLRALGEAGFRVMAPDLRGYNLTDKPEGVASYRSEVLCADVSALVRALGYEQVNLCGHDWGGAVAWLVASMPAHRGVIRRLAVLNAPHPMQFLKTLSLKQLRKSWYMLMFQLPRLPEWILSKDGFRNLRRTLRGAAGRRGVFSDEDLDRYVEAFRGPGALTGPINYYRAALRRNPVAFSRTLEPIPASTPVLLIWGEQDPALGVELTHNLEDVAPNLRVEYVHDSGHWVQQEQPERVNHLLIDFFRSQAVSPAARTG